MPTVVRQNERSWAIQLITELNLMLQTLNLKIARAGGESTISTGHQSMFPDVLLYGDEFNSLILQGWELKMPDTLITDTTFIKDAERKARSLSLNSFFIWNFTAGVLYIKDSDGNFGIAKQWNQTNHIISRDDVTKYKTDWLALIKTILIEINTYLATGEIKGASLGEIVSDSIVAAIIERNKKLVSDSLRTAAIADAEMQATLDVWWMEIQVEFTFDEDSQFDAYSKMLILNWANRIVFANLIKYKHNAAMAVDKITSQTPIIEADGIFETITENCDFYSIFHGMQYNVLLPEDTWNDLANLNIFLVENGLEEIQQKSLQTILEKTVTMSKREVNGQFTTPVVLADILAKLTIFDWTSEAIDPCCGTGSISQAILNNKKQKLNNVQSVETTWASDKFSFPLQIANISLTSPETINLPNRIFQSNVFELETGQQIGIVDPTNGNTITVEVPAFKSIVSNLPFIPFEKIATEERSGIVRIREEVEHATGILLSERNDYYAYIIFQLRKIIDSSGRIGVITSNSWLGTLAGRNFYLALREVYNVEQLHISGVERWFKNADVVTIILILSRKDDVTKTEDKETVFAKWIMPLEELGNSANKDQLVNSCILHQELNADVVKIRAYTQRQIDNILQFKVSLSAFFHDIAWLEDIKSTIVPIFEVYEVVRGMRRGQNKLFYPAPGHGIESCYIKRMLKSTKSVDTLIAQPDYDAFFCSLSEEELKTAGHVGALTWIKKFENCLNNVGEPLTQVLKTPRLRWYEAVEESKDKAEVITTVNAHKRLFFAKFEEPTLIDQRLFGLSSKSAYPDAELNHALLNSVLGMFFLEAVGFGRGLGALDINSKTMRNAYMLNPNFVTQEQRAEIIVKFNYLLNRGIYETEIELECQDRYEFDLTVLRAYGIEKYYDDIKQSLLSMQSMRLKAKNS